MKKNSVKNRRVNDEVQRALAAIVREVKDPRISPLTSVTGTEVAPDLKTCKVYISVYGDAETGKKTMEGLHSAARFIRGELAGPTGYPISYGDHPEHWCLTVIAMNIGNIRL